MTTKDGFTEEEWARVVRASSTSPAVTTTSRDDGRMSIRA